MVFEPEGDIRRLDCAALAMAGRDIVVPFEIVIVVERAQEALHCIQVLRLLPGKRVVALCRWRDELAVVKLFLGQRSQAHLEREVSGSKALQEASVKTPALLAEGVCELQGHYVLFEHVGDSQNLLEVWQSLENQDARAELLAEAVKTVGLMHEKGLQQQDLHLANFLKAEDGLWVIDSAQVEQPSFSAVNRAASLANLGLLFAQLSPRFDALTAAAFEVYCESRGWSSNSALLQQLTAAVAGKRTKRQRMFCKKMFRDSTQFVALHSWSKRIVCQRSFFSEETETLFGRLDEAIDAGRSLKKGNSATVALVEHEGHAWVVKRYNIKGLGHWLRRCLQPSRAEISWRNANVLTLYGILTPPPVAMVEKRWGPFRSKAYYICEYTEGSELSDYMQTFQGPVPSWLIEQLGLLFRAMRSVRISHGDFKARNFMVSEDQLCLIDLDAMKQHSRSGSFEKAFAKDLKRFMKNWEKQPELFQTFQKSTQI